MTAARFLLPAALLFFVSACGPKEETAEPSIHDDIATAAPQYTKVLLENEHLAVLRFTLPPQAGLPMHKGRDRIIYSLSDYRVHYITPGADPVLGDLRQGQAHWHAAGVHGIRNVAATTADFLVVARKDFNPSRGVTSDLTERSPGQAKIVFENESAKVIEVTLQPGEKQPAHQAAARAVYSLTPAKLKLTEATGTVDMEHAAGEAHYHLGGEHRVQNVGSEPVRYLVFELM